MLNTILRRNACGNEGVCWHIKYIHYVGQRQTMTKVKCYWYLLKTKYCPASILKLRLFSLFSMLGKSSILKNFIDLILTEF